ncbi:MAG: thiolase family protein [Pseudomonadales bacterium]
MSLSPSVAVLASRALPVGRYMPGRGAAGAVLEHERLADVVLAALGDAGVAPREVGALLFTANPPPTLQLGFAPFFASRLGISAQAQMLEVSALGATGAAAFDLAVNEVRLGHTEVAVALGVHFESQAATAEAMAAGIRAVGDVDFQSVYGLTPIAWYALDAARYCHDSGATRRDLAAVAVKSREFARRNPLAQLRDPLSLEAVLAAPPIVEPLGLFDVPARGDGAVCIVVGSERRARSGARIEVAGRGYAHDGHHQMGMTPHSMTRLPAARQAASRAMATAGLTLDALDVLELYAPCTITEVLVTEALGLFAQGHGASAALEGRTGPGGDRPVNTSGGCLSRGHPSSITGLYGLHEVVEQLQHHAGERQLPGARVGLALAEGGNYNTALAHCLVREEA